MGTDQGFLFSETRFSSDRTVVFEDNDEGYGSTKITFRAMYKDDVGKAPTADVRDVVVVDTNDSVTRIIDDCFGNDDESSADPFLSRFVNSCRLEVETDSDLCTAAAEIRTPVDSCWRSHKIHVLGETDGRTNGRTEGSSSKTTSGGCDFGAKKREADDVPWKERKTNIDNALSWLRNELEGMRAQDKQLMSQLQRCRETIDSLKQQRSSWEEGSEYGDLDEEEEEDHWEDWEIAEYEKKYAENPEYSLDGDDVRKRFSRDSSETFSSRTSADGRESVTETGRTGTQCADRMSSCAESMESSASSAGSLSERRIKRQYSESSSSGSTKGLYFRQDIEVTV